MLLFSCSPATTEECQLPASVAAPTGMSPSVSTGGRYLKIGSCTVVLFYFYYCVCLLFAVFEAILFNTYTVYHFRFKRCAAEEVHFSLPALEDCLKIHSCTLSVALLLTSSGFINSLMRWNLKEDSSRRFSSSS